MRIEPKEKLKAKTKNINTFSLIAVSLLWGMMLGLIPWWCMAAFVPATIIAFGSEVQYDKQ